MALDERTLRAFLTVHRQGSVGRASLELHITQSALSRTIKDLEQRLQVDLFERHSRGMSLTQAGELFLPRARSLLFEIEETKHLVEEVRGLRRGRIRIGAIAAAVRAYLPEAIDKFLKDFPNIRFEVVEGPEDAVLSALDGHEIELMIAGDMALPETIKKMEKLKFDDVYKVVSRASHPLLAKNKVSLDDVMNASWVMPKNGRRPRLLFEEIAKRLGYDLPNISVESDSTSAITSFLAKTDLLAWMPTPLVKNHLDAGKVVVLPVEELDLERQYFLYQRHTGRLSQPCEAFIKYLHPDKK